jgi:fructose-bisphosphate aldolase class I|tara:strand:- start:583 stop:1377 length:795 start_codon:yes stop_codon:yes gene_type:complete
MSKFIAAMDHSGGSTGGVLERYGQEYTEADKMDKVHAMRMRMISTPSFNSKNIWASILYKDSVDRGLAVILNAKDIQPYLKIDSGCNEDGTLKQFPVKQMIEYAIKHECRGTKMRSIIKDESMIVPVLLQQFALARVIHSNKLMPIIEPEIPIDHPKKRSLEIMLKEQLANYLATYDGECILKLTLPDIKDLYLELTTYKQCHSIVGLSGGYSTEEACKRLSNNPCMSASFSRALSEGLFANQTEAEFENRIGENISLIKRSCE